MQTNRRLWAAGLIGTAAAILAVGCGQQDAVTGTNFDGFGSRPAEMSIDLAQVDGGTGTSAEAPNFGEKYFSSYLGEDEPVSDPLGQDPRMNQLENRNGASIQYLRVTWGNLQRGPEAASVDTSAGSALDWTGSANVSDGLLLPLRVLRFERYDSLARPKVDRQTVSWVSHTGPGWDGVLLKIVVPPAHDSTFAANRRNSNNDGLGGDDTFTFSTAPLTVTFPLEQIADLDTVIMIDDTHGVTFTGFSRGDVSVCPRGSVVGAWVKVADDSLQGGFFRAEWTSPLGVLVGQVRGRWGVVDDTSRVFVGKIIDRRGQYLGHVRGGWAPDPSDPTHGVFSGQWFVERPDGSHQLQGAVRGQWRLSDRITDGGLMRGVWASACAADGGGGA